ncbi:MULTISPECIES: hypothetical protein [unclassified Bradyrhizobium]|uniref:hypothetical protein n=1 Tax=unclassified Bradyrhizobium TaxID=2631580 RepID=UPI0028E469B9|nr:MULTISPECIES: hypothetical protein [unclassified Bradyrhizobium]
MPAVRRLNRDGRERFRDWLQTGAPNPAPTNLLTDPNTSEGFDRPVAIDGRSFESRLELGEYLLAKLNGLPAAAIRFDEGLWDWLSLFYVNELLPPDASGRRQVKQIFRYSCELKNRLWSRHIVRMSWMALKDHGQAARVMLAFPIDKQPETLEQIGGQQEAFGACPVVGLADQLYWDSERNTLKRGAQGKKDGTPRRLVRFIRQLRRTYDPPEMTVDELLKTLPREFERWKSSYSKRAQASSDAHSSPNTFS